MKLVADTRALAMAAAPTATADVARESGTGTRDHVIQLLLAEGPITATHLAQRLALSAAGIRRHLDVLEAEGAVVSRSQVMRGGRGRPARVYLLTESGRAKLPHAYDDIAVQAMQFLAAHGGPDAIAAFARQRADGIVAGREQQLAEAPDLESKVAVLAEAFSAAGYAASIERIGSGEQLCQHHCPVAHVAEKFPQLCEAEMAMITRSLGSYAQRLATIARGDSFCTTFIPTPKVPARSG